MPLKLATIAIILSGCMAEPTVVECSMDATDCKCECRTSIENPTTVRITK